MTASPVQNQHDGPRYGPLDPSRSLWLAFTFLEANQTSRFGMSNGFALVTWLLPLSVDHVPAQDAAAPSVQRHSSAFNPTTGCSAPVPRIGTQILAGVSDLDVSLRIEASII
jgi:hypothetical protein